ncbi:MAG: hypothetical protein C0P77_013450 [Thermoanaerobacterales bacterium]|nr:hypothetical protein [Thermoanaerobacterales bacterium]
MARRRFDPVSFVLGCATVAAGVVVLAGGELIEEARWLLPATLIGVGAAVLVRIGRRHAGSPGAAGGAGTAGGAADDG